MTPQTHISPWEWNAYGNGLIAQCQDGLFIRVKDSENRYFNPDFEALLAKGEVLKPALKKMQHMTVKEAEHFATLGTDELAYVEITCVTDKYIIAKVKVNNGRNISKLLNRSFFYNALTAPQIEWCLINRYDVYERIEQELAIDQAITVPIDSDFIIDEIALYRQPIKIETFNIKFPKEENMDVTFLSVLDQETRNEMNDKMGISKSAVGNSHVNTSNFREATNLLGNEWAKHKKDNGIH